MKRSPPDSYAGAAALADSRALFLPRLAAGEKGGGPDAARDSRAERKIRQIAALPRIAAFIGRMFLVS
jgi:hypothetical protein